MINVCGTLVSLLGLTVYAGWIAGIDNVVRISAGFSAMTLGTATCFILAGLGLMSARMRKPLSTQLMLVSASVIAIVASLFIVEHIYDINLHIDFAEFQRRLVQDPRPGRMAPNTAASFLLFSLGLAILAFDKPKKGQRIRYRLPNILAIEILLIGGISLLGYGLNLQELYAWTSLSRMALHTAIGLIILGIGLLNLASLKRESAAGSRTRGDKILHTAFVMILIIGISTSALSFGVLEQRIEKALFDEFKTSAEDRSNLFDQIIQHRSERAIILSKNQELARTAITWLHNQQNQGARNQLEKIAESVRSSGFDTVNLEFGNGQTISPRPLHTASLIVDLQSKYHGQLLWDGRYYLRSRIPVDWEGETIAYLVTEQSLEPLDALLPKAIRQGESVDLVVCMADRNHLKCFPDRFNAMPFYPAKTLNGTTLPMVKALDNKKSGSTKAFDYRGAPVLAAYSPIGDTGLAMVQKINLSEIYAPIKARFQVIFGITLLLLLMSYLLIRREIRPLVQEIVDAQRQAEIEKERFIAATEGGIDNFYIFEAVRDPHNKIVDFRCLFINTAGSKLINKKPGEMIGKLLLEEVPVNRGKRLFERYKYVIETGITIAEEFAIDDKDVNASWIYWQIVKLGDGMAITSRDITEKKRLENELAKAQQLHKAILDSASYSIIATDEQGIILSMNRAAERMLWYSEHELAGKFTPEIFHDRDEVISRAKILSEDLGRTVNHGFEVFIAKAHEGIPYEQEWTYVRKDGSKFPVKLAVTVLKDNHQKIYGYLGIAYDITEQKRAEEYIKHIALHDVLTGLPNRALFEDRVQMALEGAKRNNTKLGIALLDLDHFKRINDSLGHHIGDRLLQETSKRLLGSIRPTDTVARIGGDEFAFLFLGVSDPEFCEAILQRVHAAFEAKMDINDHVLHVTPSIGMAVYPESGTSLDTLLINADTAMYRAKELGRNSYQIFTMEMLKLASRRQDMESQLRGAIEKNQFELFFQPQINLHSMTLVGFEALARWQRGPGVYCSPNEFIPLAEESGLIVPIGDWLIRAALNQAKAFEKHFGRPIRTAINISPRQFRQKDLVPNILDSLRESGVAADTLEVEITESLMMADIENSIDVMGRLRAAGVKIAMDDFGTGYSSLSYLSKFKFDRIKIDQSFIKNCIFNPEDASMVKAIISISKILGIAIIAEGVETLDQLRFIKSNGCDEGQGYLIGMPLPAARIGELSFDNLQELLGTHRTSQSAVDI